MAGAETAAKPLRLSPQEIQALVELIPSPLAQAELGRRLGTTSRQASRIARKFEGLDFVEREADERGWLRLSLTSRGRAAAKSLDQRPLLPVPSDLEERLRQLVEAVRTSPTRIVDLDRFCAARLTDTSYYVYPAIRSLCLDAIRDAVRPPDEGVALRGAGPRWGPSELGAVLGLSVRLANDAARDPDHRGLYDEARASALAILLDAARWSEDVRANALRLAIALDRGNPRDDLQDAIVRVLRDAPEVLDPVRSPLRSRTARELLALDPTAQERIRERLGPDTLDLMDRISRQASKRIQSRRRDTSKSPSS